MGSRWQADALCAGTDPNGWDAEVATERQLADNARMCRRCPVRAQCAQDAMTATVWADKSRMLRAGVICNRTNRATRLRTEIELTDILARLGVAVTAVNS